MPAVKAESTDAIWRILASPSRVGLKRPVSRCPVVPAFKEGARVNAPAVRILARQLAGLRSLAETAEAKRADGFEC